MKSEQKYFVTGCVIIFYMCISVDAIRRRRQSDFLFPDEFKELENRGEFLNPDPFGIPSEFPEPVLPQPPRFPQQQGFLQQPGFPQQQGFPQQPGFPLQQQGSLQQQRPQPLGQQQRFPQPQGTSITTPMPPLTTPSPAFLACMATCPTTSEYNPICGTNRQLYFNQQKYDCALKCGAQVQIWRRGSCAGLFNMMRG